MVTQRPEDYFAEMAKSDEHMHKVRRNLMDKKLGAERKDKMRKLREAKKFGKQAQHEAVLRKAAEKKQMLTVVNKHKKGLFQRQGWPNDLNH